MPNGRNIRMIRKEAELVSIPVEAAVYCEACELVSNSSNDRCGVCGSGEVMRLVHLIDGPPTDPEPGPAAPARVVPIYAFERLQAA